MHGRRRSKATRGRPPRQAAELDIVRARSYSVVHAASSFSNVTGLVAGFALAAVVLVFTIAATSHGKHQVILGFAAALFALAYVNSLIIAYSFGALSGRPNSAAAMTHAMLLGSGLSVSFVAILGGFVALSAGFLPHSSDLLFGIAAVVIWAVQSAIWFPHREIIQEFGPPPSGSLAPVSDSQAHSLIKRASYIAAAASAAAILVRCSGLVRTLFGPPQEWEYMVIAGAGILYVAMVQSLVLPLAMAGAEDPLRRVVAGSRGLSRSVTGDGRLTMAATRNIASMQCLTLFVILSLLP
jgi:hypothetical protein